MVFNDVRMFYEKQFALDPSLVLENEYFSQLKPRLKKLILDAIFELKYQLFQDVFEDCSEDFRREMVLNFKFRFHNENHPDQDQELESYNANIFNSYEVDLPIIKSPYEISGHVYFIVAGQVHLMDSIGMYDYGILKKGSYFGDISILLDKPNEFSYWYDPNIKEKPLLMFRIERDIFKRIIDKYPLEKDLFQERAKKKDEYFNSYKALSLLKIMKSVVKNPDIIK